MTLGIATARCLRHPPEKAIFRMRMQIVQNRTRFGVLIAHRSGTLDRSREAFLDRLKRDGREAMGTVICALAQHRES